MIVRAAVIVTMNGAPIRDGSVRIERGRIARVGKAAEIGTSGARMIELADCVLLPGLINAHCHLDYTCLRGNIPRPHSFTDWIRAINAEKAQLTPEDYLRSIGEGLAEARRFGTTTMVNLEAFPELIPRLPATPLRIWWCPELIDVIAPQQTEQILAPALDSLRFKNKGGGLGLAPHALFTASAELYRRCAQIAITEDLLLTTHLAESREEMEMFHDAAGPLFEFMRAFRRSEADCGNGTPMRRFLEIIKDPSTPKAFGAQDDKKRGRAHDTSRWIVAHLNELAEDDFQRLARLAKKFSIAHCPRSHAYFGHSALAFERLRHSDFNICLATDSLASNSDLSLFAEMREFQKAHPQLVARELFEMVTVNPARALRREADLGQIAQGYLADMIALPISPSADIYEQIIAFLDDVPWMMIGGEII